MPKDFINTYATYNFYVDGKIQSAKVAKIVSEEPQVANITKEISVFEKYSSKKTIRAKVSASESVKDEGRAC